MVPDSPRNFEEAVRLVMTSAFALIVIIQEIADTLGSTALAEQAVELHHSHLQKTHHHHRFHLYFPLFQLPFAASLLST